MFSEMLINTESYGYDVNMGPQCCYTVRYPIMKLPYKAKGMEKQSNTTSSLIHLPITTWSSQQQLWKQWACLWSPSMVQLQVFCLELQHNHCFLISRVHHRLSQETQLPSRGCNNLLHKTSSPWFFCVIVSPHFVLDFKTFPLYYSHNSFFLFLSSQKPQKVRKTTHHLSWCTFRHSNATHTNYFSSFSQATTVRKTTGQS